MLKIRLPETGSHVKGMLYQHIVLQFKTTESMRLTDSMTVSGLTLTK